MYVLVGDESVVLIAKSPNLKAVVAVNNQLSSDTLLPAKNILRQERAPSKLLLIKMKTTYPNIF